MPLSGASKLDNLVNDLANQSFAIVDQFLSPAEVESYRHLLLQRFESGAFKPAGIGNANQFKVDNMVRSDLISWIDPDIVEPPLCSLFQKVDEVVAYLNRTCYLGLANYEFHFAKYAPGSFFKRHLDTFQTDDSRKISVVLYLNEDWKESEGGAIHLYLPGEGGKEETKEIFPIAGRLVCFRSDLIEHEVIPATRERMSITGWLKTRPVIPF